MSRTTTRGLVVLLTTVALMATLIAWTATREVNRLGQRVNDLVRQLHDLETMHDDHDYRRERRVRDEER